MNNSKGLIEALQWANKWAKEPYSDSRVLFNAVSGKTDYEILEFLSELSNSHGVESIELPDGSHCEYVNAGDTYTETVLYVGKGLNSFACTPNDSGFIVSDWGTILENAEKEYCESENVTRCGYCGKFTPLIEGIDWNETECESCNNCVAG